MKTTVPRKPWRMSHRVAGDLRTKILQGTFGQAEKLPPVPALAERLGISQHHLREALRLLEQDGFVRVVSGRNGGVFVNAPDQSGLTRSFGLVLARSRTLLKDLMKARSVIEPAIAALAATEATDSDLAAMADILDSHATIGCYRPGVNAEFHLAVAASTHNTTLLTVMTAMEELLLSLDVRVGQRSFRSDERDLIAESLRAHTSILAALQDRNPERAASLSYRHVVGYEHAMAASGIDLENYEIANLIDDVAEISFLQESAI